MDRNAKGSLVLLTSTILGCSSPFILKVLVDNNLNNQIILSIGVMIGLIIIVGGVIVGAIVGSESTK